ncbi:hypothetical protein GobsT_05040 [Gemmata obscuriglobus]|uniref:Uncharacterized protein n=1 Tax=Gemmata obscuriglobus TaxID=114 RepID=A0A2Z3HB45_9BACT|nr:hypothetical protein [Gemmata obscuriglobus]AWM40926.1 hypothetical protein C1280_30670 [Gemmata obscuriglobus]QEG25769.1 hypothetical protein GobsT_05040 [Gemmata obscuriglobus]VTR99585.1 unnamed protein product [Gemmata obscuriglobus UQM 2246]
MTEPSSTPPPPPPAAPPAEGSVVSSAASAILPLMRLLPAPPLGAILTPPEPQDIRKPWFFVQVWAEVRLAAQMYFDSRYRISRTAQITFPLLAALGVLNYFLLAHWFFLPIISPIVERLMDGVLAVVAYRVLLRELDRYRTVLDYLARFSHR